MELWRVVQRTRSLRMYDAAGAADVTRHADTPVRCAIGAPTTERARGRATAGVGILVSSTAARPLSGSVRARIIASAAGWFVQAIGGVNKAASIYLPASSRFNVERVLTRRERYMTIGVRSVASWVAVLIAGSLVAACSSSGGPDTVGPNASKQSTTGSAPASASPADPATKQAITAAFKRFFNSKTTPADSQTALQHGA